MKKAFIEHAAFPKQYSAPFLELDHGVGCYLWDTGGTKYLDFGSGIAVNALGHGRADLADIAAGQMRKIIHVSNLYTTAPAVALAEKLVALGDFAAVHFGNSGTEANEAAIKFARLYGKRKPDASGAARTKILCFEHAFHGRTMGTLSVTPSEKYQAPFGPLLPGVAVAKLNDVAGLDVLDSGDYCGVIIEPVQGEGGLMRVDRVFASKLNEKCRKLDIILIADEVQTGLGRCGHPLASTAVGLEPDVVSLAKPLAGGLPLSATLIPAKVNDLLGVGDHGTTFGGGPVTTAVAGHVVDTVLSPEFLERVGRTGEYLSRRLRALVSGVGAFVEVRGLGMLLGVAVADDRAALLPGFLTAARDRGLLLLRSGSNVIRIAPPLIITEAEIDEGIAIIDAAAAEVFGR
jgi:acetylornithine/succinyldiaminopimelate/putrescine aminotransferase